MRTIIAAVVILFGFATDSSALDSACTTTANLSIADCPEGSVDWYTSYENIVDGLDRLAKTTPGSFTVVGVGTFTATGNATYSVGTASGVSIGGGGLRFPDGTMMFSAETGSGTHTDGANARFKNVIVETLQSTGTAPSLTATGATFGTGAAKSTFTSTGGLTMAIPSTLAIDTATVNGNVTINGDGSGVYGALTINATVGQPGIRLNSIGGTIPRAYHLLTKGAPWGAASGKFAILDDTAGAYRFHLNENGQISIGNDDTPDAKLEIIPLAVDQYALMVSSQDEVTPLMAVNKAGNLGIGTASPAGKLDVVGDAYFGAAATRSTMTTTGGALFSGNLGLSSADLTPDFPIDMGAGVTSKRLALFSNGSGAAFYGFGINTGIGAIDIWRGDVAVATFGNGAVGINTAAGVAPVAALEVVGGIAHHPRTIAQLLAITPAQGGVSYFCSNCSPAKMVVSTGTSAGNFADIMGGAFQ